MLEFRSRRRKQLSADMTFARFFRFDGCDPKKGLLYNDDCSACVMTILKLSCMRVN